MSAEDAIMIRLAELKRAFDASFAEPAELHDEARQSVLAIRAGEGRFAVRVEDLEGVEAVRRIVEVPAALPGLLGVAGIRGRLLAAYDLGALVGQAGKASPFDVKPGGRPRGAPLRWLLLCGGDLGVGLVIDEIEALLRVPTAELVPVTPGSAGEHIRGVLRLGSTIRGVIDVASVVDAVARRAEDGLGGRRRG